MNNDTKAGWRVTMRSGKYFPGHFETAIAAEEAADGWSKRHPESSDFRIGGTTEYFDADGNKVTLDAVLAAYETADQEYLAARAVFDSAPEKDADTFHAAEDAAYERREKLGAVARAIEVQERRIAGKK
ncbi:MAG: hypothetical protein Q8P17_02100 [bacterium]|nr:hypothetical protein [bacterium]